MERYLVIALVGAALILFWYLKRPDVSSARARELVAAGARLVDVRSRGEFAAGHLDGARNVPVDELDDRTAELAPADRPIVVYCASGVRSAAAKRRLRAAGFSNVYNLGAMSNW